MTQERCVVVVLLLTLLQREVVNSMTVSSGRRLIKTNCGPSTHESFSGSAQKLVEMESERCSRQDLLRIFFPSSTVFVTAIAVAPTRADSKVEGYKPPTKALGEEYRQGTAALADMDEDAPVPKEAYTKLPSGVIYADLRQGKGTEICQVGSRVNLQWVLRKSNGYFVDSSEKNDSVPFIFTVGDEKAAITGVNEGVVGMRVGGVRRLIIPPSLAYVQGLEDGLPGPLPVGFGPRQQMRRVQTVRADVPGEYIYLEVQMTRIR